eukprot:4473833-Prymnesium_polylepis.1
MTKRGSGPRARPRGFLPAPCGGHGRNDSRLHVPCLMAMALRPLSGWVALHNSADKSDMPAAIVGVARFAHLVPIELIPRGDVEDRLRQHCVGPQCNV